MKNKLISMTDFVLEQRKINNGDSEDYADLVCRYAKFLKQLLELWMFVPCDKDGNLISESYNDEQHVIIQHLEWEQAKERCLFEGVEIKDERFIHNTTHFYIEMCGIKIMWNFNNKWVFYKEFKTIEDLVKHNPKLTKTAIKQIGL